MTKRSALSKTMSVMDFDNGYWFAVETKAFAREIGIAGSSRLRKDELEILVRRVLLTGHISKAKNRLASGSG